MKNGRKITAGAFITCLAALLTIVALIVYAINVGAEGYYQGASVPGLVLYSIIAIVLYIVAICLGMIKADGSKGKILDIVTGIMQIAAPVLVAYGMISLISSRVEGLGFIYFSNADVILEVQTPANLASAGTAITSMVLYGVALFVGIVAAFMNLRKKER